jgi:phage replication-related protein YjqB (UPF0714/DUF867 family)
VVAVHGREDGKDPSTVWVGGRRETMRLDLVRELTEAGFSAEINLKELAGAVPENICNRGRFKKCVQFEIPRSLRMNSPLMRPEWINSQRQSEVQCCADWKASFD